MLRNVALSNQQRKGSENAAAEGVLASMPAMPPLKRTSTTDRDGLVAAVASPERADRSAGGSMMRFGSSRNRSPPESGTSSPINSPKVSLSGGPASPASGGGCNSSPGRARPLPGKVSSPTAGGAGMKLPMLSQDASLQNGFARSSSDGMLAPLPGGQQLQRSKLAPRASVNGAHVPPPGVLSSDTTAPFRPSTSGCLPFGGVAGSGADKELLLERLAALEMKVTMQEAQLVQMASRVLSMRRDRDGDEPSASAGSGSSAAPLAGADEAGQAALAMAIAREAQGEVEANSIILSSVRQQVAKIIDDQPKFMAAAQNFAAEATDAAAQAQGECTANAALIEALMSQVRQLQEQMAGMLKAQALGTAVV